MGVCVVSSLVFFFLDMINMHRNVTDQTSNATTFEEVRNVSFFPVKNMLHTRKRGRIHGYPSRVRVGRSSAGEGH